LIIRWSPQLTPQQLGEQITDAEDDLSLLVPVVRRTKANPTPDNTKAASENTDTKKQDNGVETP